MTRLWSIVALLLVFVPSAGAAGRLALRVTPTVAFAPATVEVMATVATSQDNRAIEIVADSPSFYRSSRVPLDGRDAPRANFFQFRDLPQGTYEVTATLFEATGARVVVRQQLTILRQN